MPPSRDELVARDSSESTRRNVLPGGLARIETAPDAENGTDIIERRITSLSQRNGTVGAAADGMTRTQSLIARLVGSNTNKYLRMGEGKELPPMLPDSERYVVDFDGPDDPLHPMNWPFQKKLRTAVVLGFATFVCTFGSSIFSPAIPHVAAEFNVSNTVAVLGMSLYVLGFAFGPILWAPLSELFGRTLPIKIAIFGFTLFQFAVATGKDIQTIMICRFFGGVFASCPLAVVAAVFGDMFDNRTRGLAITSFSLAVFTSPLMAPFIGGFMASSSLGWRWVEYITGILGAVAMVLCLFFFHETYHPAILVQKAADLRRQTHNWGIHARQDEVEINLAELIEKNFSRPLKMLFTEPIVLLISIYCAFIYGILYLFMTAYPMVFQGVHGMGPGVGGLPFFGMILGQICAGIFMIARQPSFQRKLAANKGQTVPEWRLPEVVVGGVFFAAGLFWFSWTGYTPKVHWIVPTLSGIFTGFGIMCIFLQSINYIVDAYLMFAASALAANTFLRSLFGAAFPLFATQMFNSMKIQWAGTLLGCIAVVLIPVPLVFYKYGGKIRGRSKYQMPSRPGALPPVDEEQGTPTSEHIPEKTAVAK